MSAYEDTPEFDDEEEDTPSGAENDESTVDESSEEGDAIEKTEPAPTEAEPTPAPEPEKPSSMPGNPDSKGQQEVCPYCGQPLSQRLINGKIWYYHEGNSDCKAIFQGITALKEARDTKALLEEEKKKEKEQQAREETARRVREEAEKPFREAAQKTADFAMECLKEELAKIQSQYTALLESQTKDLTEARQKLESLLKTEDPIEIPARSTISNAIEAYKTKLNQSADGDPNAPAYEYLENSFNELLAARDDAEALIQSANKSAQAIKTRLDAAIKDVQEKMEQAAIDGKEYETIQNEITGNGQGAILALQKQLENLERLFFRKA